MVSVLWLGEPRGIGGFKWQIDAMLLKNGINPADVVFTSLWNKVDNIKIRKGKTKDKWILNPAKRGAIVAAMDNYIHALAPSLIVCNDEATLWALTKEGNTLSTCRGSVYTYQGLPVIVIDKVYNLKANKIAPWIFVSDFGKLSRWVHGKHRDEPKFEYTVCRTVEDCYDAQEFLCNSIAISVDLETKSKFITCVGYTGVQLNGKMHSYVIPFFNPFGYEGAHWKTEAEEIEVWSIVRAIHDCPVHKILQNGAIYDAAYFIRYHVPVRNFFADTMHLFHCIYTEPPKKLWFISSILLDHCKYWKDESKGHKEDAYGKDVEALERYWRYNALDCYNTMLNAKALVCAILQPGLSWALDNYKVEFPLQIGPALTMSMHGFKWNFSRRAVYEVDLYAAHEKAKRELRIMADDPDLNPMSGPQIASLLYDTLGAAPIKTRGRKDTSRSIDKKFLRIIATQHTLFKMYIQKLWDCKEPANNISKYIKLGTMAGRFLYTINAGGTETGRAASSNHQFWVGTNIQNMPKFIRDMLVADAGKMLIEIDYSQSDAMFIAHECQDPKYIEVMMSGKDTHAIHAAFFFQKNVEDIIEGHKTEADWVDHPITGVRQNTKRIVHGSNFQMQGFTLYLSMGHEATVATAAALGEVNSKGEPPHLWTQNELTKFCDKMLSRYHVLYIGIRPWFESSMREAIQNGNLVTCAYGRTRLFLGDIAQDASIQREISAYYGQGGTAGNINRSLNYIYYKTNLMNEGIELVTQTHDSITFQAPLTEQGLKLIPELIKIMEVPTVVHGRKFHVRTDVAVGLTWGKGMRGWNDKITVADIKNHEVGYDKKFAR